MVTLAGEAQRQTIVGRGEVQGQETAVWKETYGQRVAGWDEAQGKVIAEFSKFVRSRKFCLFLSDRIFKYCFQFYLKMNWATNKTDGQFSVVRSTKLEQCIKLIYHAFVT